MNKRKLNFLIIGAMRSGTTTLHNLLKQHPEIALPPGKEVPFFSDNEYYNKGLKWYLDKNFLYAKQGQILGTITPQYMFSQGEVSADETARRIKEELPDVKLIAILRNPVKRTYSHYNYAKRHNYESRDFTQAVADLLKDKPSNKGYTLGHRNSYLTRSLYAMQLKPYFDLFSRNQILILYTDDLESDPESTLQKILKFLGVASKFNPSGMGQTYHKGGGRPKVKLLTPGGLGKYKAIRVLWRKLIPYPLRKRFELWLHVWNIKPDNTTLNSDDEAYKKLVDYFESDIVKLQKLTGHKVPWSDWR